MSLSQSDCPAHACRPVVILANRPKEDMDKDCVEGLSDFDLEIHTRSGIPSSITDLNRVAAGTAKTILLLNPPDTEVSILRLASNLAAGARHPDVFHLTEKAQEHVYSSSQAALHVTLIVILDIFIGSNCRLCRSLMCCCLMKCLRPNGCLYILALFSCFILSTGSTHIVNHAASTSSQQQG